MDESRIEGLLVGKKRRWLGVVWTLVLSAVLVLPGVDASIKQYRKLGEFRTDLAARSALPERTRMLSDRVAQLREEMADSESCLVSSEALSTFKQELTRMARVARCRLRSIRPGSATRRALGEVMGRATAGGKRKTKKPEWEVEEHVSVVSLQGSFTNLIAFLSDLDREVPLLEMASLDLHAPTDETEELILDVQIRTFDLLHNARE